MKEKIKEYIIFYIKFYFLFGWLNTKLWKKEYVFNNTFFGIPATIIGIVMLFTTFSEKDWLFVGLSVLVLLVGAFTIYRSYKSYLKDIEII